MDIKIKSTIEPDGAECWFTPGGNYCEYATTITWLDSPNNHWKTIIDLMLAGV